MKMWSTMDMYIDNTPASFLLLTDQLIIELTQFEENYSLMKTLPISSCAKCFQTLRNAQDINKRIKGCFLFTM